MVQHVSVKSLVAYITSAKLDWRFIRITMNQSLSDYIMQVRMNSAEELLRSTSLSVSEISDRTGFVNSSYIFTIFKKVNGCTPNSFRQR